jgi:acylphosphatase
MGMSRQSHDLCVRCYVAGREQAQALGLSGYARNLTDGRVEVLACGPADAVERLKAWLRVGPPGARVSGVACESVDAEGYVGFTTG